jgi:hypothetical protein
MNYFNFCAKCCQPSSTMKSLGYSLVSYYFWFMTCKSSWVPSHTQGLFPTCYIWYSVSWLLQELLVSSYGWGVRPRAWLFYIIFVTPQVFGLHLCICIASHEHIHSIITCASSYVSMLQHNVSLKLMHRGIMCGVPMLCLVHYRCLACPIGHVSSVACLCFNVSIACFACFNWMFHMF